MPVDLRKLLHALTVQRLGSFSRAADELGLTQPSLSRSISALEQFWNVRIFERDRTGVVPTRIGSEMLQEAAQLLAGARTLDHNMKLRSIAHSGSVAFGMSPLVGTIFMADILASVAGASPDLRVTGKIETLADLLSGIKADRIEFAVFSETEIPEDDTLAFEIVGSLPISFLVRAGHPLTKESEVSWGDLAPFLLAASTPTRIPILPREPTLICDDYGVAKAFMLKSDAVWLASPWAARPEIASGLACKLSVAEDQSSGPSYLCTATPKNRLWSPAAGLITSKLGNILSEMGDPGGG